MRVPLLLKELEHAREAHRVDWLGCGVSGHFELDKVSVDVKVLAGDGTLASHAQLLGD